MRFLYHAVPKSLVGSEILPLNSLVDIQTDLFSLERKKYVGREYLTQLRVPHLHCLWNDVIHLTAIPPYEVYNALRIIGAKPSPSIEFFEIPLSILDLRYVVFYRGDPPPIESVQDPEYRVQLRADHFAGFDEQGILDSDLSVPLSTKNYYMNEIKHGRRPLIFWGTTHILYKGRIDLEGVKTIRWSANRE